MISKIVLFGFPYCPNFSQGFKLYNFSCNLALLVKFRARNSLDKSEGYRFLCMNDDTKVLNKVVSIDDKRINTRPEYTD